MMGNNDCERLLQKCVARLPCFFCSFVYSLRLISLHHAAQNMFNINSRKLDNLVCKFSKQVCLCVQSSDIMINKWNSPRTGSLGEDIPPRPPSLLPLFGQNISRCSKLSCIKILLH